MTNTTLHQLDANPAHQTVNCMMNYSKSLQAILPEAEIMLLERHGTWTNASANAVLLRHRNAGRSLVLVVSGSVPHRYRHHDIRRSRHRAVWQEVGSVHAQAPNPAKLHPKKHHQPPSDLHVSRPSKRHSGKRELRGVSRSSRRRPRAQSLMSSQPTPIDQCWLTRGRQQPFQGTSPNSVRSSLQHYAHCAQRRLPRPACHPAQL
jgi:hypothetical protein